MMRKLVSIGVALIVAPYLLNQVRKPTRFVGRWFLWTMNKSHARLTDWGLEHISIEKTSMILDVGCGGGRTVQKLAELASDGRVCGIDYSSESVSASRAANARSIEAGRVEVQQASVSELPFPDATFDLVTAIETHYYWPRPAEDLREVLRVVKPGGTLAVIAELYRGSGHDLYQRPAMALLRARVMSRDEHRAWFESAGFADVQVHVKPSHGWICATGTRGL